MLNKQQWTVSNLIIVLSKLKLENIIRICQIDERTDADEKRKEKSEPISGSIGRIGLLLSNALL